MDEKSRDERIKELLEQPAVDALGQITGPTLGDGLAPEEEGKDSEFEPEVTDTGGKKVRIPVSRLKTLTSEVKDLRQQVEKSSAAEERIAALEAQLANTQPKEELPAWWKEDYGEGDDQLKAYRTFKRGLKEELRQELQQERQQERQAETARQERIQSIEQSFDEQMGELEEEIGRELTTNQKTELLEIIEEYSPMEDGKYTGYMSVSKAHAIWQKGQGGSAGKEEMARIAGSQSSGGTGDISSSSQPDFNWRRKFGL